MKIIHHETGRDAMYKIWHYMEENMIIYTYSEGGSIVFHDRLYPIKRGALCFISADNYRYTVPDKPAEYDRSKIFIDRDTTAHIIGLMPNNNSFFNCFKNNSVIYAQIPDEIQNEVEGVFRDAEESMDNNEIENFVCSFFKLMTYLNKYSCESIPKPDDTLSKAIEFINNNYSQQISLEDICNEVHMSKYYFCRKFKEIMGMSVMRYVLKTRIAAAQRLMDSNKNITMSEISENCGFSSVSYFCQVFKSNVGKTPIQYRNLK